jgi:hypothetical protein
VIIAIVFVLFRCLLKRKIRIFWSVKVDFFNERRKIYVASLKLARQRKKVRETWQKSLVDWYMMLFLSQLYIFLNPQDSQAMFYVYEGPK